MIFDWEKELEEIEQEYEIGKNSGDFINLEEGDNRIRFLSLWKFTAKHWFSKNKNAVCIGKKNNCIYCVPLDGGEPNKPNIKFYAYVLARKTSKLAILQMPYSVIRNLVKLNNDEDWKFNEATSLPDYDINIVKTVENGGKNPSDTKYSVIPSPKSTPLSKEQKEIFKNAKPLEEILKPMKEKAVKEQQEIMKDFETKAPFENDKPKLTKQDEKDIENIKEEIPM